MKTASRQFGCGGGAISFFILSYSAWRSRVLKKNKISIGGFRPRAGYPHPFFPQAMLGGFSFRAGEHTTSAVRKIAGPNQNDYNFRKNRIGNVPEKPARSIFDDSYTLFALLRIAKNVPEKPIFFWAKKSKTRKSRFRLNFCVILHQ